MSPKRAIALGTSNAAERRVQRAKVGRLSATIIAPMTEKRYQEAVTWFFQAIERQGLELPTRSAWTLSYVRSLTLLGRRARAAC